jgi:hypothetical protein
MIRTINVATGQVSESQTAAPSFETIMDVRARMVVSPFQAKAALANAGLLATAEAAVAQAGTVVQLAWDEAVEFRRLSPSIVALGASIGLTDEQLDNLFIAARSITV